VRCRSRWCTGCRAPQRQQSNPTLAVIDKGPLGCTFITEPEVLNLSRLLPRPDKLRPRFSGFARPIGFYQEQFSLSQFQEGFAAFRIGAMTQHEIYDFLVKKN